MRIVALIIVLVCLTGCHWYSPDLHEVAGEPTYNATEAAAWWTQIYALISAAQLAGLVITAIFAGLAWHSNENEKRIRLRAYLSLRSYRVTDTPIQGTSNSEVEFAFEIPNGGATPAYNVAIKIAHQFCTEDDAASLTPNDPETSRFVVLQQSSMSYKFGCTLDAAQTLAFRAGRLNLGGAILVEYDDVFKKRHRLLCRMVTYKDTDGLHKVKPCGVDEAT